MKLVVFIVGYTDFLPMERPLGKYICSLSLKKLPHLRKNQRMLFSWAAAPGNEVGLLPVQVRF